MSGVIYSFELDQSFVALRNIIDLLLTHYVWYKYVLALRSSFFLIFIFFI